MVEYAFVIYDKVLDPWLVDVGLLVVEVGVPLVEILALLLIHIMQADLVHVALATIVAIANAAILIAARLVKYC